MAQDVRQTRRRSELVATLVDRGTRDELRALAAKEDRSVSAILRRALQRELAREHAVEQGVAA